MAWMRIDDKVRTHPKIVAAGPAAAWFWFCGICYCREHLTDGFIPIGILPSLAPGVTSWRSLVAKLVQVNLWHQAEGGYQVHDFLDWNPSRAEVTAKRSADSARKKSGIQTESGRKNDGGGADSSRVGAGGRGFGFGSGGGSGSGSSPEGGPGETAAVVVDIGPPRGVVRGGLVVSPAEFAKLQRVNAFVGERLRVPHKLHADFVAALGGASPDAELRAFYAAVDEEIATSGESIVPDVWKWLEARFKPWLVERVNAAETAKFMQGA